MIDGGERNMEQLLCLKNIENVPLQLKGWNSKKIRYKNDDVYTPNIGEWLKREDSGMIEEYDIEAFRREAALMAEMEDKE